MHPLHRLALVAAAWLAVVGACTEDGTDNPAVGTTTSGTTSATPVESEVFALCAKATACLGSSPPDWTFGMDGLCTTIARHAAQQGPSGYPVTNAMRAALLDCVAAAADCAAVRACVASTTEQAAGCEAAGNENYCDGDVYVTCEPVTWAADVVFAVDCAAAGLMCSHRTCALATCDPATAPEPRCEGNRLFMCGGDVPGLHSLDCASEAMSGAVCGETPSGATACVGTGPECCPELLPGCESMSPFNASCDGDVLVSCVGGREARFDCTTVEVLGHTYFCDYDRCVAGDECAVIGGEDSCSGSVARFCMDGVWLELDCADYGFSGCSVWTADTGSTYASCTE